MLVSLQGEIASVEPTPDGVFRNLCTQISPMYTLSRSLPARYAFMFECWRPSSDHEIYQQVVELMARFAWALACSIGQE